MEFILIIVLFIILLALSAFFSGIEIAFFSLTAHRVRAMRQRGLKGMELVKKLKMRPHRLMATILVGNNLVNIFIASLASAIAVSAFGTVGVAIATVVITIAILILGEVVPKALAISHAGTLARLSARTVKVLEIVFFPIVTVLESLSVWLTKIMARHSPSPYTVEEDVRSLVQIGHEKGTLEDYERSFVERLFLFDDKPVSSVMMPLSEVFMFRHDQSIYEAENIAVNSGYSRFPVYKQTKANICGIVHIKDMVTTNNKGMGNDPIERIITPSVTFSEKTIINDVFLKMRKLRIHYAIVLRSSKRPVGIVTLEDIIEELIGEIHDEFDIRKN
jgi:putative hemolysin